MGAAPEMEIQQEPAAAATGVDGFRSLVVREAPGLVAAAALVTGDRATAEDVVADVLERTYARWPSVSRMDRPGAWVRRAVINAAISSARRAGSERRALQRLRNRPLSVSPPPEPAHDEVWAAVKGLPASQRTAVALHYGADLALEDVASDMGLSESAVKSLLHRARQALRDLPGIEELRP